MFWKLIILGDIFLLFQICRVWLMLLSVHQPQTNSRNSCINTKKNKTAISIHISHGDDCVRIFKRWLLLILQWKHKNIFFFYGSKIQECSCSNHWGQKLWSDGSQWYLGRKLRSHQLQKHKGGNSSWTGYSITGLETTVWLVTVALGQEPGVKFVPVWKWCGNCH